MTQGLNWYCFYLSSRLSSSILSALLKPRIPVCSNDAVVQSCAVDKSHCVFSVCPRVVSETYSKENYVCYFIGCREKKENYCI